MDSVFGVFAGTSFAMEDWELSSAGVTEACAAQGAAAGKAAKMPATHIASSTHRAAVGHIVTLRIVGESCHVTLSYDALDMEMV